MAARIGGRYWMYWGEGTCFAATSDDLVRWTPVEFDATADRYLTHAPDAPKGSWEIHRVPGQRVLRPILFPRPTRFDSLLVEPGPPAVRTDDGIVLVYNGANHPTTGDPLAAPLRLPAGPGPARRQRARIARRPVGRAVPAPRHARRDRVGQVGDVCFAQGLVLFQDRWHLYVGMADSKIGCATAPFRGSGPPA